MKTEKCNMCGTSYDVLKTGNCICLKCAEIAQVTSYQIIPMGYQGIKGIPQSIVL
jgi:hypothetical protein